MEEKIHHCPIALSISFVGDKWTLLILRDMILYKKTRFKEFRASRGKIATNILTIRLKKLLRLGFIEVLNPSGTKKSTQYLVTDKGLFTLPLIIELYLLSAISIEDSLLTPAELKTKNEVLSNSILFKKKLTKEYLDFVKELRGT